MENRKICLGLSKQEATPLTQQLQVLKDTGFDGFFVVWDTRLDMDSLRQKAVELDMPFQSIHAPWDRSADLWRQDEPKAQLGVQELKDCIDVCVRCGAPVMVAHVFIGFKEHDPTPLGLVRYGQVIDYAREKGIKIAFENTEGEEYLDMLMEHFQGDEAVGFCWDSGHEMCYNRSRDLLADYGDHLICTHLNDNLGVCDPSGRISWLDDLHLLPFDGVADWQKIADRLQKCGFSGELTFELSRFSKPGRNENNSYKAMPYEAYIKEVFDRACRVAELLK